MRVLGVVLLCLAAAAPLAASASTNKSPQKLTHSPWYRQRRPPPPVQQDPTLLNDITTKYFTDQLLDHFDPSNKKTWSQRYFANPSLHAEGGPVFIFIEGESEASSSWIARGGSYMYELATIFKAKMYVLEHRFFGSSKPTPNISTDNLRWLSPDQALADLAYFIEYLTEAGEIKSGQKVAVFGGSYPGNLAAWARLKYPHLIHAAVASSAPVRAEENFKEYFEVVTRSMRKLGGDVCADNVKKAFDRIQKLVMTTDGLKKIETLFYMCSPLNTTNPLDVSFFYEVLANPFAIAAQYNRVSYNDQYSLKAQCDYMGDANVTPDKAVEKLAVVFLASQDFFWSCIDWRYTTNNEYLKEVAYKQGDRQWVYMTCATFGYFQTTDGNTAFPKGYIGVDFFLQMCKDAFGEVYDDATVKRGVKRTNTVFGELRPGVDNVIYVNGEIDPWHSLSITKDVNKDSPAILISSTSHCYDMYANSAGDAAELKQAREKIKTFLKDALYNGAISDEPTLGE